MFFLLHRQTNDGITDNFAKISKDSPKLVQRSHKRCQTFSENFQRLPKIAKDFRGRPEDISIIEQRI